MELFVSVSQVAKIVRIFASRTISAFTVLKQIQTLLPIGLSVIIIVPRPSSYRHYGQAVSRSIPATSRPYRANHNLPTKYV